MSFFGRATHSHAVSRRMFYHDYNGVILLYDTTSARSCHRLQFWRQELSNYTYERTDGGFDNLYECRILTSRVVFQCRMIVCLWFRYGRVPEAVIVGDERKLLPTRKFPVLIVGTKTDMPSHIRSEHRVWVDKAINDYAATEVRLVSVLLYEVNALFNPKIALWVLYVQ